MPPPLFHRRSSNLPQVASGGRLDNAKLIYEAFPKALLKESNAGYTPAAHSEKSNSGAAVAGLLRSYSPIILPTQCGAASEETVRAMAAALEEREGAARELEEKVGKLAGEVRRLEKLCEKGMQWW